MNPILAALTCAAMTWAMTTSAGWLDRRWGVRMGDIGDNPREYEFEPLTAPAVPEPITVPTPTPEPVKEPAHV